MIREFTPVELLQALTVEVIRRLWDRGRFNDDKWARMVHDNWFDIWVEWKTAQTMKDVDIQIAKIQKAADEMEALAQEPVFSERLDGDTPLGGPMQSSHPTLGTYTSLEDEDDRDFTDVHP